jgi:signal transduction histidine kinase
VFHATPLAGVIGLVTCVTALAAYIAFTAVAWPPAPKTENAMVAAAVALALASLSLDHALASGVWRGVGFPVSPYAGVVAIAVCGAAIVQRMMSVVAEKESQNIMLGQRIETTKANLLASESARRSLEVSHAVTQERERMMREIHDGIGSSLVAALASAERQGKQNTTAVVALKSALTDLRIAVDSLEPVEGNVTTLLASLRYRVEPELKKSGIGFDWMVDDVPELEWLDSPNALHILRIFQESLGNTLGHANATKIRVSCRMDILEGHPGIKIEVSDNGDGFDASIPAKGRGRKNMMDRAEALGGRLTIQSSLGQGSTTLLWLPLSRASS